MTVDDRHIHIICIFQSSSSSDFDLYEIFTIGWMLGRPYNTERLVILTTMNLK